MKRTVVVIILALLFASPAAAGDVSLAWDPPDIATDVTGYKIYAGTHSGGYSQDISFDAGPALTYTIRNLPAGPYFFVATAYNAAGYESVYSNEVMVLLPPDPFTGIVIIVIMNN